MKNQSKCRTKRTVEEIVDNMTLFDDDLMSACFDKNIPAAELLLRVILDSPEIKVLRVEGQEELKSPLADGRRIILDILATDAKGRKFNVEVQQKRGGANERRARFHSSMLDSQMLKEKQRFRELRDSYVIFMTKTDYFRKGCPVYTVDRRIRETKEDEEPCVKQ